MSIDLERINFCAKVFKAFGSYQIAASMNAIGFPNRRTAEDRL